MSKHHRPGGSQLVQGLHGGQMETLAKYEAILEPFMPKEKPAVSAALPPGGRSSASSAGRPVGDFS